VVGDPGAVASSSSDPGADEPTNVFEAGTFEYLNAPLPTLQQKLSSVKLTQSAATSAQGASALVSAGDPSHASVVPAPADLQARMRARSQQFEFLVRALEELVATGVVQSFKPIPSASDNRLGVMRSGMPCWSLLKRRDRDRGRVPKRGWEVVDDGDLNSEAAKEGTRSSFKHGRVVLLLSVRIDDVDLALLEIEPRPTASAFRMIAFVQSQPLAPVLVIPALETIREHEGVFQDSDLDSAFSSMTANPVVALKHSYTFDASDQLKVPTGLRASILGRALQGIALSRTSP
jgi:hypothetical protein